MTRPPDKQPERRRSRVARTLDRTLDGAALVESILSIPVSWFLFVVRAVGRLGRAIWAAFTD